MSGASRGLQRQYELLAGQRWYVAQTLNFREALAVKNLAAQGYPCFFPRFRKTIRHARQLRSAVVPVFRGYVFVAIDTSRHRWRAINGTLGVARLLQGDGHPLPVPSGVVETLVAALDGSGLVRLGGGLKAGERVRVLSGPFAEALGTLDRIDDNGRVRVLLDVLGAATPTIMDRVNLTAA